MKRKIEIDVKPSPEEIARELWAMDAEQQAAMLVELSCIRDMQLGNFAMQMEYMKDELSKRSITQQNAVIRMVKQLFDYVKEAKK